MRLYTWKFSTNLNSINAIFYNDLWCNYCYLKGTEKKQEMSGNSSIIKQINIILIYY